jgi:hypothetical protein
VDAVNRLKDSLEVLQRAGVLERCTRLVVTADDFVAEFGAVPGKSVTGKPPAEDPPVRSILDEIKSLLPGAVLPGER